MKFQVGIGCKADSSTLMILLSYIPFFLLKIILKAYASCRWIYLGHDHKFSDKISHGVLDGSHEIDYAKELYKTTEAVRSDFVGWIDLFSAGTKKSSAFFAF